MAIDTGTDIATYAADGTPSLGLDAPEVSGVTAVLQDVAHVITTRRGVVFYDTSLGVPVPAGDIYNSTPDDAALVRIAGEWSDAAKEQVDAVSRARFVLSRLADGKGVKFVGTISTADGTFPLSGTAGEVVSILFPKVT